MLPDHDAALSHQRPDWHPAVCGGILVAIFLFHAWFAIRWTRIDTRPLGPDDAIHAQLAYQYLDCLPEDGWRSWMRPGSLKTPPLYHFVLGLVLPHVEDPADAGSIANLFFVALLVGSTFAIGTQFFDKKTALIASNLVMCTPIMTHAARHSMLDLALTATVAFSFYCYLKSRDFESPGWSVLTGVALGLGMLTHWTAMAYLLGPVLYSAIRAVMRKELRWASLAMICFILVTAPWYLPNMVMLLIQASAWGSHMVSGGWDGGEFQSFLWFPLELIQQLNIFYLIIFLPGFTIGFRSRKYLPLMLWFGVSLVLCAVIFQSNNRSLLPALPAAAVLSLAGIPWRNKLWMVILINCFVMGVYLCFQLGHFSSPTVRCGAHTVHLFKTDPPLKEDWKQKDIIQTISELKSDRESFSRVAMVSNATYFNPPSFNMSMRKHDVGKIGFVEPFPKRWFELSEFILFKTGDLGPAATLGAIQPAAQFLAQPPRWFGKIFKEKARWDLPDGSQAILFKREPSAVMRIDLGEITLDLEQLVFGPIKISGVLMKVIPDAKADASSGQFKEIMLSCQKMSYKNWGCRQFKINLIKPMINIPKFLEQEDLQLMGLKGLSVQCEVPLDTLVDWLGGEAPWFKDPKIEWSGQKIAIKGFIRNIPAEIDMSYEFDSHFLETKLERFFFLNVSWPRFLLSNVTDRRIPLQPNVSMPFHWIIRGLEGRSGYVGIW